MASIPKKKPISFQFNSCWNAGCWMMTIPIPIYNVILQSPVLQISVQCHMNELFPFHSWNWNSILLYSIHPRIVPLNAHHPKMPRQISFFTAITKQSTYPNKHNAHPTICTDSANQELKARAQF